MMAEFNDKMGRPQVKPTTFDLSELLSTMIRLLPEPQQEVVELTFFKGLSQREIAAQKSISLGTVKTRFSVARQPTPSGRHCDGQSDWSDSSKQPKHFTGYWQ
jgi:RNA polymerase sigma factor (sigma-70 family)